MTRGVAASLEFNLHHVGPIITGGLVAHPLQKGADVLKFFRESCASLPDEMMLAAGMLTAPDGSGAKLVGLVAAALAAFFVLPVLALYAETLPGGSSQLVYSSSSRAIAILEKRPAGIELDGAETEPELLASGSN